FGRFSGDAIIELLAGSVFFPQLEVLERGASRYAHISRLVPAATTPITCPSVYANDQRRISRTLFFPPVLGKFNGRTILPISPSAGQGVTGPIRQLFYGFVAGGDSP